MELHPLVQSFSSHLQNALQTSIRFAQEFGHQEITSAHILYGLAAEKGSLSSELLLKNNFPVDLLKQELVRKYYTPYLPNQPIEPVMPEQVVKILTKAIRTSQLYKHPYIGTEHVLACLLNLMDDEMKRLFQIWHVDIEQLQRQILVVLKSTSKFPDLTETLRELQTLQEDEAEEEPEFPVLETLAKELTTGAALASTSPLIGREKELEHVQQILGRKYKNNPLLVGKPGVGKTAIIEGLAQAIRAQTCAPALRDKRIFMLELGNLVAGTMYRGEFEQRMKHLVEEVSEHPDIILFIDEIHTLVGAGSTGQALDAANILKPALARGEIRCIGATTWEEYQKYLAHDQALARRFQIVSVGEPTKLETAQILDGVKSGFERFHAVSIRPEALETALDLSDRYLTHTAWPDKAIDLLDDAASHLRLKAGKDVGQEKKTRLKKRIAKLQKTKNRCLAEDDYGKAIELSQELQAVLEQLEKLEQKPRRKIKLTPEHIRLAVARRTGIVAERLDVKNKPMGDPLFLALTKGIIGQDEALKRISQSLQRAYSPLKDPQKPLGAFLLTGPSGVGKSETAKIIARELFGTEQALIRLDMSEYAERHSLSKLIGAPAGYIGYQESGLLTKAVRQRPLSIVLFDEIEKAHPDIFQLLLQILDEGKLTDTTGMVADFRQTLILLTSNLGLDRLLQPLGFDKNDGDEHSRIKQEMGSAVRQFLRPEILNRLDDVIYFSPLGIPERKAIIEKRLAELNDRLGPTARVVLSEDALDYLTRERYNQQQGARSLLQLLRELVEIPVSEQYWQLQQGTTLRAERNGDSLALKTQ